MRFLNANTHIPFSAQTLNKKFIKPFYKICSENGAERTLFSSGFAILWAAGTYSSPSESNGWWQVSVI